MERVKAFDWKALLTALAVTIVIAALMLMPIGGDARVATTADGTKVLEPYYWSVGSMLILGPVTGDTVKYLSPLTVAVGLMFTMLGGFSTYFVLGKRKAKATANGHEGAQADAA